MFSIGDYLKQIRSSDGVDATPPKRSSSSSSLVVAPVPTRPTSSVDYTALIRTNETKDRIIQASIDDVKPLRQRQKNISLAKPSEEVIRETTERTRRALDLVLQSKLGTPSSLSNKKTSEYIRYTSSNVLSDAPTSSRIIKIVEVQQDPMAPSKFKQKKQMERPPSPPAPVLHAPIKKVSKEEQAKWYIPPAISNWKNPNGYTIELNKRLAVDGRDPNLNNTQGEINENFMNLATALEEADKKAREEIKIRNLMKKKLIEKENKEKEEKLRILAQRAREERSLHHRGDDDDHHDDNTTESRTRAKIREERRRMAEKELKLSRMGTETKLKTLLKDREVSERTQLGLSKPSTSVENQFDSRLFTKSTQITNSEDQVYDNPLFTQQVINNIYKTSSTNLNDVDGDKEIDDLSKGPIQFEKAETDSSNKREATTNDDEYGLQINKKPKI